MQTVFLFFWGFFWCPVSAIFGQLTPSGTKGPKKKVGGGGE
jgi:hypothetical protein